MSSHPLDCIISLAFAVGFCYNYYSYFCYFLNRLYISSVFVTVVIL